MMSILPARSRVLIGAALCVGLTLPALGFGVAIGHASPPPAPMDDPAPAPPPPAPDPSAIINEANTILPMITQFAQILPAFLDPNAAPYSSGLQPPMLNPFVAVPSS